MTISAPTSSHATPSPSPPRAHDAPDLLSIGEHCAAPSCGQVDFLPFRCDCCSKNFCLDHRSYSAHACQAAGARTTELIVCPLCARGVRLKPGQEPNAAFEEHTASTACDPRNYTKVHHKPRCPVGRCHEKLSLTNTYHCKTCSMRICLKHRLPDDHGCAQAKVSRDSATATKRVQVVAAPPAPAPAAPSRSQPQRAPQPDPGNSVKGTALRRMQLAGGPAPQPPLGSAAAARQPMDEECPQCRARFGSVELLIRHVEEWHPAGGGGVAAPAAGRGGAGAAGPGELFRCHHCRSGFSDPVALVQHSELCGQQQQQLQQRAVAAGAPQRSGQASKGDCVIC